GRVIRRATSLDEPWIIDLGGRVFEHLGDYRMVLPRWLELANITAWVDEQAGFRRGFSVLGFFHDDAMGAAFADLLALAVEPAWRRNGLGRALLDHALQVASVTAQAGRLRELRLCVADDNRVGQRLYRSTGFERVD